MTEVQKVLETYGKQVVAEMKTRLIGAGKVASGALLKALGYEVEQNSASQTVLSITIDTPANEYAYYVDKGRKPGKMPPVDNIKKWCKLKGIPEGAAWAIAKNIGKFGIPPTNFYTISVTRRAKQLDKLLEVAILKDTELAVMSELSDFQ